ncbi:MAG: hypothetical protein JWN48_6040 [Myxococcaceae bacterium]|nr:hypothetical protein [Myxococcaceae bacterium]
MDQNLTRLGVLALALSAGACGADGAAEVDQGDAPHELADMATIGAITGVTDPLEAGTISGSPGTFGSPTTLTATPNPGWRFLSWTGCSVPAVDPAQAASPTLSFGLTLLPETCTAHFEKVPDVTTQPTQPAAGRITITYQLPAGVTPFGFESTDPGIEGGPTQVTVNEGANFSFHIRVPFFGPGARPRLLATDCGTSSGGALGSEFEGIDGDSLLYKFYMNDTRGTYLSSSNVRNCAVPFEEGAVVRGTWPADTHVTPTFSFKMALGQTAKFPSDTEFDAVLIPGEWTGFSAEPSQGSWNCSDGTTGPADQPGYVTNKPVFAGQFLQCNWSH